MRVFLLFDISGGELILILIFVLLFFGSKGIPDVARTMGRAMRQLRDASNEVQREINRSANEVKRGFEEQKRALSIEPPATSVPQRERLGGTPTPSQEGSASPEAPSIPSTPQDPAA